MSISTHERKRLHKKAKANLLKAQALLNSVFDAHKELAHGKRVSSAG